MSKCYWLPVIAIVGLALAGAVHGQPISNDAGSQPSSAQTQAKPHGHDTPRRLETIDVGVERINRTLESLKSEPKSAREDERAEDDLKAQMQMAYWAKLMFWAAVASIILTVIGIVLIAGTLVYTKQAAKSARDMVDEAEKTTAAALVATQEAKRQADLAESSFQTVQRPYVFIFGVENVVPYADDLQGRVRYAVANFGQTPAIVENVQWFYGVGDGAPGQVTGSFDDTSLAVNPILGSQEKRLDQHARGHFDLNEVFHIKFFRQTGYGSFEAIPPNIPDGFEFYLHIVIEYRGPFTLGHEVSACWIYEEMSARFMKFGGNQYNYSR